MSIIQYITILTKEQQFPFFVKFKMKMWIGHIFVHIFNISLLLIPHCHFLIPLDKIISNKSSFIRIYMYMQLPTFSKVQIQARNSMIKNKKEKHAINQKCTKRGYLPCLFHTLLTWTRNSISTNNNLHQMIHQVYFRQFMLNI
jgi:hypothetical protein